MVSENPNLIKSERLALELLGLVNKRSRIEADVGYNDDLALAYAFPCYARQYCRDLLGNTEDLDADESITDKENPTDVVLLNDGVNPFKVMYGAEDYIKFKRNLQTFINDNLGKNISGTVNVFDLWRNKDAMFGPK